MLCQFGHDAVKRAFHAFKRGVYGFAENIDRLFFGFRFEPGDVGRCIKDAAARFRGAEVFGCIGYRFGITAGSGVLRRG